MTGDVLLPVLATFIVVNVILLVRAGARGQLVRLGAAAGFPLPAAFDPRDAVVAAQPVTFDPSQAAMAVQPVTMDLPDAEVAAQPVTIDPPDAAAPLVPTGRDALTGLDDAATWDLRIAEEDARIKRYRRPTAIVRLELDGLERLTGAVGEEAGDRLLRAMADTLRRLARDTDHIARLGRGEFGVIMPETSEASAVRFVERVSRACDLWLESGAIAIRLPIGWAATSGEIGLADTQRLAVDRMQAGQRPDPRPTEVVAIEGRTASDAPRPHAPNVVLAPSPMPSWDKCRVPDCDHKKDHRRDRRR